MATRTDLRRIALARIKSAETLIKKRDWEAAWQMMGLSLECALKAAACKALCISSYPEKHSDSQVAPFFMTHRLERLLLLSGLSETFSAAGDPMVFSNWSTFIGSYPTEWEAMRYNDPRYGPFDEPTTRRLFQALYQAQDAVLKTIQNRRKW